MANWTLRQASEADAAAINATIHAAFEEYRGQLNPPSGSHRETEETVRREMERAAVILAERNGKAVGCIFYQEVDSHYYFFRLAVLPAERCQGLGRDLIAAVEARARGAARSRVRCAVRTALWRLRQYYEKQGYRLLEYRAHAGFNQATYAVLEKDLG